MASKDNEGTSAVTVVIMVWGVMSMIALALSFWDRIKAMSESS